MPVTLKGKKAMEMKLPLPIIIPMNTTKIEYSELFMIEIFRTLQLITIKTTNNKHKQT